MRIALLIAVLLEPALALFNVSVTYAGGPAWPQSFTGRVYLLVTSKRAAPRSAHCAEPRLEWEKGYSLGPGFAPEYFAARDVRGWRPGVPLPFSGAAAGRLALGGGGSAQAIMAYEPSGGIARSHCAGCPQGIVPFANGPRERQALCAVQAVMRIGTDPSVGTGEGNGYSAAAPPPTAAAGAARGSRLVIDMLASRAEVNQTEWVRLVRVRSALLSAFHKSERHLRAVVLLPKSFYAEPLKRYPTIISIPGFGDENNDLSVFSRDGQRPMAEDNPRGVEFLRVVLDARCEYGHHTFADSATNGPVGSALIKELLPVLSRDFRAVRSGSARFVYGASSGGWAALHLQLSYPRAFGGAWSVCPDPVSFSHFLGVDLYAENANAFVGADGKPRPLVRFSSTFTKSMRGYAAYEEVHGPGEQLGSLVAAFSPRGGDGAPQPLWDRSGAIDPKVASAWRHFDLSLAAQRAFAGPLAPKLRNKLHVFAAGSDAFSLFAAVERLREVLDAIPGAGATVEVLSRGKASSHFALLGHAMKLRIRDEMCARYLRAGAASMPVSEQRLASGLRSADREAEAAERGGGRGGRGKRLGRFGRGRRYGRRRQPEELGSDVARSLGLSV